MSEEPSALERMSLKTLFGMLTLGQLWTAIGAVIVVVVGAFGFGVWVTEEFHVKPISTNVKNLEKDNNKLAQQQKFLELSFSYLNARIKNKEEYLNDSGEELRIVRITLSNWLKEMYKGGDITEQRADGFVFDESVAGGHEIRFTDGPSYLIPRDVKGHFVDLLN